MTGTETRTKLNKSHARGRVRTSLAMTVIVNSIYAYIATLLSRKLEVDYKRKFLFHFYQILLYCLDRIAKEV